MRSNGSSTNKLVKQYIKYKKINKRLILKKIGLFCALGKQNREFT